MPPARLNALSHGVTATTPLVEGEDPVIYERHRAAIAQALVEISPTSPKLCGILAARIASLTWRQLRVQRWEAAIVEEAGGPDDLMPKFTPGLLEAFERIARYEAHLRRELTALLALATVRPQSRPLADALTPHHDVEARALRAAHLAAAYAEADQAGRDLFACINNPNAHPSLTRLAADNFRTALNRWQKTSRELEQQLPGWSSPPDQATSHT